jgi:hypothetical protein
MKVINPMDKTRGSQNRIRLDKTVTVRLLGQTIKRR